MKSESVVGVVDNKNTFVPRLLSWRYACKPDYRNEY